MCGHKAQSYVALRNHMMARHEKRKPFLCEICGYAATLESTVDLTFDESNDAQSDDAQPDRLHCQRPWHGRQECSVHH